MATRALVREVPASYATYYAAKGVVVDAELARRQHADYVAALRQVGLESSHVQADEERPDCVFIEDTAVVWEDRALIMRMNPAREGEQRGVEAALAATHRISRVEPPAALEGGDVLHTDSATFVGITARTNHFGAKALESFLMPFGRRVISVEVQKCLHLKSAATYLGEGTVIVAPEFIDQSIFAKYSIFETAPGEAYAANCLRIGKHLLMPRGFPRTRAKLEKFAARAGATLVSIDCSEFRKGDGSLTCLSLIW